jgi:hypothetical protein
MSQIFIGRNRSLNVCHSPATSCFEWHLLRILGHFNSLSDALEVKVRTTSVNDKITYAAEVHSLIQLPSFSN